MIFQKWKKDNYIIFENNDFGFRRYTWCKITSIHNYNSFENYLENETLKKCLPSTGINVVKKTKLISLKYEANRNIL